MKSTNLFFTIVGVAALLAWFASFPLPITQEEGGMMRMNGVMPIPPGPLGSWVSLGLWWGFLVTAIFALVTWIRTMDKKAPVEHEHHIHHA